jgi:hypothetical protein
LKEQHRNLVDKLLTEAGARRHCFKRSVRAELKLAREDLGPLTEIRIAPDGFMFDHAREEVICYEVETSSPINEERLAPYTDWWWFLDDLGWTLRLVVLRGYRCHGVAFEIDLQAVSLTWHSDVPAIVGNVSPRFINKGKRERGSP